MTIFLDSNVLIAASIVDHKDRQPSRHALDLADDAATAAHCLSELYNTLTKPRAFGWRPDRAASVVKAFSSSIPSHALSPDEHSDAISRFAAKGGIGARLYDFLIGETALRAGARRLLTWNTSHFIPLFPQLTILTPAQYLETL